MSRQTDPTACLSATASAITLWTIKETSWDMAGHIKRSCRWVHVLTRVSSKSAPTWIIVLLTTFNQPSEPGSRWNFALRWARPQLESSRSISHWSPIPSSLPSQSMKATSTSRPKMSASIQVTAPYAWLRTIHCPSEVTGCISGTCSGTGNRHDSSKWPRAGVVINFKKVNSPYAF